MSSHQLHGCKPDEPKHNCAGKITLHNSHEDHPLSLHPVSSSAIFIQIRQCALSKTCQVYFAVKWPTDKEGIQKLQLVIWSWNMGWNNVWHHCSGSLPLPPPETGSAQTATVYSPVELIYSNRISHWVESLWSFWDSAKSVEMYLCVSVRNCIPSVTFSMRCCCCGRTQRIIATTDRKHVFTSWEIAVHHACVQTSKDPAETQNAFLREMQLYYDGNALCFNCQSLKHCGRRWQNIFFALQIQNWNWCEKTLLGGVDTSTFQATISGHMLSARKRNSGEFKGIPGTDNRCHSWCTSQDHSTTSRTRTESALHQNDLCVLRRIPQVTWLDTATGVFFPDQPVYGSCVILHWSQEFEMGQTSVLLNSVNIFTGKLFPLWTKSNGDGRLPYKSKIKF